jgi:hypothetical protein
MPAPSDIVSVIVPAKPEKGSERSKAPAVDMRSQTVRTLTVEENAAGFRTFPQTASGTPCLPATLLLAQPQLVLFERPFSNPCLSADYPLPAILASAHRAASSPVFLHVHGRRARWRNRTDRSHAGALAEIVVASASAAARMFAAALSTASN